MHIFLKARHFLPIVSGELMENAREKSQTVGF
jgi:hypothetical protein